jgi:hypothetical protein
LPATSRPGQSKTHEFSRTVTNVIPPGQRFKYHAIRHDQALTAADIEDRLAFSGKLLRLRKDFWLIHFSDESGFILGDDRRWVWCRKGQENPSTLTSLTKFPHSLMAFEVIGIG